MERIRKILSSTEVMSIAIILGVGVKMVCPRSIATAEKKQSPQCPEVENHRGDSVLYDETRRIGVMTWIQDM